MTTHIICSQCGSTEVYADATARWDARKGEWIMGTVHDDRYCDYCGCEADLIEIDEAEGLEIQLFGMIKIKGGSRLVEDHETPQFYDLMVKTIPQNGEEILTLHEIEDMTRKQADKALNDIILRYRLAGVESFHGAAR